MHKQHNAQTLMSRFHFCFAFCQHIS